MAKMIEYDNTGVEESSGGTGVKIKPGVHPARIVRCTPRDTKRDGTPANDIEVALDVGEEFDWVFTYIGLDVDWKLAEFTRALGLKEKGKFDPEKQVGKIIRVQIKPGSYEGEYSPNAGRLMKAQPGDEDLIGQQVSESSSRNGGGPDEDDAERTATTDGGKFYREGQPDPEDPNEVVGSYDEWSDEDLEAEVTDRDLTLPGGRASKKNKMIAALRADDEAVAGGGSDPEPDPDEGTNDDAPADDYDDWDVDRLKSEWNDRDLGEIPVVRGSNAEGRLKAKLIEQLRADDEANPFDA